MLLTGRVSIVLVESGLWLNTVITPKLPRIAFTQQIQDGNKAVAPLLPQPMACLHK